MKKITLILALLAGSLFTFAQTTCAGAGPLSTLGNTQVTALDYGNDLPATFCAGSAATAAAWYIFTAPGNGIITVSSDIAANNNIDTRLSIYSGSCGALTCQGDADDVSYPSNLTSVANVTVTMGTTYYIVWDDRWVNNPVFEFSVTFQAVSSAPNSVTMPSPVDMATGVAIDPTDNNADGSPDNAVSIAWTPDPNGAPATEYDIFFGQDPANLANLTAGTVFTGTGARITGSLYNTVYYWQIVAINGQGSSTNNPIWSYTTEVPTAPAPSNATTPTPVDGATNVVIDTADNNMDGSPDNAVAISWVQDASGQQPTAYTIRLGTDPAALNTLTTTFTGLAANFINQMPGTTYYWQVVPTNQGTEAINQPLWSYTTAGTASNADNKEQFFTASPNPTSDLLNIITSVEIDDFQIYNALGQSLNKDVTFSNSMINVATLPSGVYFLTLTSIEGTTQTEQIIKK